MYALASLQRTGEAAAVDLGELVGFVRLEAADVRSAPLLQHRSGERRRSGVRVRV